MKLHLPKMLLTAVLAACCTVQTAYAGWSTDNRTNGYIYYYDESAEATGTIETLTLMTAETNTENIGTAEDKYSKLYICAGYGGEANTKPESYTGQNTTIGTVEAADGVQLTVAQNPWQGWKSYAALTMETLKYGDGTGSGSLVIANPADKVTVEKIAGTLATTTVHGTLTIGKAGDSSTTHTLQNGSIAAGGKLILAGGITTLGASSGNQTFDPKGTLVVNSGATLKFAKTDVVSWGANSIELNGGTWEVGGTRQSVGGDTLINLSNGKILDAETPTYGDGYGALDAAGANIEIRSSGTSSITGGVRLRGNDVIINVTDGSLSVDTFTRQNGSATGGIVKKGAGTLKITSMATTRATTNTPEGFYAGATTMEAGTIEYAMDTEGSYSGTISGTGNIAKSGTGTVTLATVSKLDGEISVTGGTLNITNISIDKTMKVTQNGGTLNITTVDADMFNWTPTAQAGKYYVYVDGVATESTTGNGFYADESTYQLFEGYAWTGTKEGYTTSNDGGNTYLTATGDISTIYHVTTAGTTNMESIGLTPTNTFTGYEVYSGATLDFAGRNPENISVVLRGGSTLANTGNDVGDAAGTNVQQIKAVRLKGDATINATGQMGIVGSGLGPTSLDLGGHKLTKTGADKLLLMNTAISSGSIDIQAGTVRLINQTNDKGGSLSVDDGVAVNIAGGASLDIGGDKGGIIDGDFLLNSTGTGTININRDVNIGSDGGSSTFEGTISVNSNQLYLGNSGSDGSEMEQIDLSKATIALNGGTQVRYFGGTSTIGTLDVIQDGTLYVHATNKNAANQGLLTVNTLKVAEGKTVQLNGYWENNVKIGVLTGEGSLNQVKGNWTYSIEAVNAGFGSISNAGNLTLGTASTTVNLGSTVTNTGTVTMLGSLVLSGDAYADFTVTGAQYDNTGDTVADDGATDGYLVGAGSTSFSIVSGGTINKDGITSVTYNGETVSTDSLSIADNKLTLTTTVAIEKTKDYYVNTTVDYATDSVIASDDTTGVILNGGTLNLNTALNSAATKGIVAAQDSTINIAANTTLNNSSVSSDGGTATITGGNTAKYNMGTSINANAGFGENWAGTVVFGEGTSIKSQYFDLNNYGVAGSTIQFNGTTSDSYLGAARPNTEGESAHTYAANIELNGGGLTIGNGYGGSQYNFTGDFKGTGKLTVTKGSLSNGGLAFTFKGDMSQWSGELSHSEGDNNTYTYAAAEGKNTTIGNAITAKGGTMKVNVNNAAAVAMNGKVSVTGGTLNLTNEGEGALTVKNMEVSGGKAALTGDMTVTTLAFGAGLSTEAYAVTSAGTLTLGSLSLNLTNYTIGEYKLVSSSGLVWTAGSYTTTGLADGLSAQVSYAEGSNTNLILTIGEVTTTDWSLTGTPSYDAAGNMLTLNVGANLLNYDFTNDGAIIIPGISESMMKDILGLGGLPADGMVGITLVGGDGESVTATADQQIGFQGKDGVSYYFGEMVGSNWQYQVAYIPEPASATLGLAALMMLAARRRRKA